MHLPILVSQPDSIRRQVQADAAKPKLLDRVRHAIRARHYSKRTEKAYVDWIKRLIFFHGKRHPWKHGEPEINQFLTDLAVNRKVSASTQNQALSADPVPLSASPREAAGMGQPSRAGEETAAAAGRVD